MSESIPTAISAATSRNSMKLRCVKEIVTEDPFHEAFGYIVPPFL